MLGRKKEETEYLYVCVYLYEWEVGEKFSQVEEETGLDML